MAYALRQVGQVSRVVGRQASTLRRRRATAGGGGPRPARNLRSDGMLHAPVAAAGASAASISSVTSSLDEGGANGTAASGPAAGSPAIGTPAGSDSPWPHARAPLDNTFILGVALAQRRHLALAGMALLLCVASNLASPLLMGALFETLVQGQPFAKYSAYLGLLALNYVGEPLLSQLYVQQATTAAEKVQAALRVEAFRVLLMQRTAFFDAHQPAEITTLLTKHLSAIRSFFFGNVTRDRGARSFLEALGSVLVLFYLSWRLGPILAAVIITTAAAAFLYRRQTKAVEAANASAQVAMAQVADECFSNIRLVRVFAGEGVERQRWAAQVAASFHSGVGFSKAKGMLELINRFAVHVSILALYALGGWLITHKYLSSGVLVAAIGYTYSLVFATQGALQTFTDARHALTSVRKVQALLREMPVDRSMTDALPPGAWWELDGAEPAAAASAEREAAEKAGCHHLGQANGGSQQQPAAPAAAVPAALVNGEAAAAAAERVRSSKGTSSSSGGRAVEAARHGDIELRGVTFSYPSRPQAPVLRDLSLVLPRGKVTALVGRSGAGKSTVAALLERLYPLDPGAGHITVDGTDISAFSRAEWTAALTSVSQNPVLWTASIRDNIAYGRPGAARADVVAAAKAAHAHEFVSALPQGYDTLVGSSLLSGGERQRVALARALLRDSPIVILDEATSALDAESERLVHAAIDQLVENRTVLVIAHRLSTVQSAHQIAVLEQGRVAELGTHAELLAAGGLYAGLVSNQSVVLT